MYKEQALPAGLLRMPSLNVLRLLSMGERALRESSQGDVDRGLALGDCVAFGAAPLLASYIASDISCVCSGLVGLQVFQPVTCDCAIARWNLPQSCMAKTTTSCTSGWLSVVLGWTWPISASTNLNGSAFSHAVVVCTMVPHSRSCERQQQVNTFGCGQRQQQQLEEQLVWQAPRTAAALEASHDMGPEAHAPKAGDLGNCQHIQPSCCRHACACAFVVRVCIP